MDLKAIMDLAQNMQGSFAGATAEIKTKLKTIIVNISVGGGAVAVQMNGVYEILQIDIQPTLLHIEEKSMLQDLLKLAFNQSITEVKKEQRNLLEKAGIPTGMLEGIL